MPNKKKQPARNGYYYYMLDVRDDVERTEGYRPSMVELQSLSTPGWTQMSAEDKAVYNSMAKEDKRKGKTDMETKFNSVGVSYAMLDAQEREKQEAELFMKATIDAMVKAPGKEAVLKRLFYVSHVNYYYKTYVNQEDRYCPCEISIIEFSFEDGITNKFHQILHQGDLPLGVRADAKEQAERYHDIHISDRDDRPRCIKEENMQLVFSRVVHFLRNGAERDENGRELLPPIFTMPNSMNHNHSMTAVNNALEIFYAASHERRDLFRVYPLPQLFFQLKLKFDDTFKVEHGSAILENELERDLFATAPNIECNYHSDVENPMWCSQSIALRWVYPLMDHICPKAGIEMIAGKHLPLKFFTHGSAQQGDWKDPWAEDAGNSNPKPNVNRYNDDDEWKVVKVKDGNARKVQESRKEVKAARNIPPSRAWNTATSAAPSQGNFPAMRGFPSLSEAAKPQPWGPRPSTASGRGESMGHSPMTGAQGRGRGKLFESGN